MVFFIASVLVRVLELIEIAVLLRAVLSWIPSAREGVVMRILVQLTESLLSPVRRLIERSPLGRSAYSIDLSPLAVFLIAEVVRMFLVGTYGTGSFF